MKIKRKILFDFGVVLAISFLPFIFYTVLVLDNLVLGTVGVIIQFIGIGLIHLSKF